MLLKCQFKSCWSKLLTNISNIVKFKMTWQSATLSIGGTKRRLLTLDENTLKLYVFGERLLIISTTVFAWHGQTEGEDWGGGYNPGQSRCLSCCSRDYRLVVTGERISFLNYRAVKKNYRAVMKNKNRANTQYILSAQAFKAKTFIAFLLIHYSSIVIQYTLYK